MRILLVEDNPDHQELMSLALARHDPTWQVEGAASGEEALRRLAEEKAYDMVFLDYSMPRGDGLWVLQEIQQGEAPPPVVMVTGLGDEQVAVESMKTGAYDYVVKGGDYLQRLPLIAKRAMEAHQLAEDHKRAEEALANSERRFRSLVETAKDVIWTVDLDFQYTYVSPSVTEVLGYTVEEIMSLNPLDTVPPSTRERLMKAASDELSLERIEPKGKYVSHVEEIEQYHKDGSIRWIEMAVTFLRDKDWRPTGILGISRDITERKRAEKTLEESKAMLNKAEEIAHVGTYKLDRSTNKLKWSEQMYQIFDIKPEEFDGSLETAIKAIHPDDREHAVSVSESAIKAKKPYQVEYRVVHLDGTELSVVTKAELACDERGEVVEVVGTVQDITEHKQAEEALHESEQKYRTLIENSLTGIYIHQDGKYVFVNQRFAEMHGHKPEEMLGKEYLTFIPPDDRETAKQRVSKRLRGEAVPQHYEYRKLRKDGEMFWCEIMVTRIEYAGRPAIMGNVIDITDRVQAEAALLESEEKYRNLVERANDGIWIVQDKIIRYVNPRFTKMVGYSVEELVGRLFTHYIFPDEVARVLDHYRRRMACEDVIPVYETAVRHKDGRKIDVEINASIITYKGRPANLGMFRDISERKKLEAQLIQAQKMEALGALVAGVAHEINNPINSIMFNVPLLQRIWHDFQPLLEEHAAKEPNRKYGGLTYQYLKKDLDQLLSDMGMAADRIAKIVTDMKTFSKQSDITETKTIQINEAVENAVRLSQTTLRKIGIELQAQLTRDLPLMEGNLQSIEQIVLNLVVNAIEAIDHDHGKIRITTGFGNKDGRLFIEVSDNGRGIEPSIEDRIFDPFVTSRQAEGGTGLGLSVTYNLVKAQDGEISFKTQRGKGTTFTVFFPTKPTKKPARILVVDDDKRIKDLLAEALTTDRSYEVVGASNGMEALIKLGTYHPDLFILDIFMPEMDGVEVCRIIQNEPELSAIKVILITGFPDDPKVKELADMGFTNVYVKPFSVGNFVKEVDRVLGAAGGS